MAKKRRVYNRIKVMLAEKHKTNIDLAEHLKKDPNHVSRYVRNEVQPPVTILYEIADFLQCDVKDLLVSSLEPPSYI